MHKPKRRFKDERYVPNEVRSEELDGRARGARSEDGRKLLIMAGIS